MNWSLALSIFVGTLPILVVIIWTQIEWKRIHAILTDIRKPSTINKPATSGQEKTT